MVTSQREICDLTVGNSWLIVGSLPRHSPDRCLLVPICSMSVMFKHHLLVAKKKLQLFGASVRCHGLSENTRLVASNRDTRKPPAAEGSRLGQG